MVKHLFMRVQPHFRAAVHKQKLAARMDLQVTSTCELVFFSHHPCMVISVKLSHTRLCSLSLGEPVVGHARVCSTHSA